MPAGSSMHGGPTTTAADLTRASAASPRTSLQPGPDRTTTRTDSGYERGQSGGKVSRHEARNRLTRLLKLEDPTGPWPKDRKLTPDELAFLEAELPEGGHEHPLAGEGYAFSVRLVSIVGREE